MKYFVALSSILCCLFNISGQTVNDFSNIERKVLKGKILNLNLRDFRLFRNEDFLILTNIEDLKSDGQIHLELIGFDLAPIKSWSVTLDKQILKAIDRFTFKDILIHNESIYLLFSKMIVVLPLEDKINSQNVKFLNNSYDCIEIQNNKILVYPNSKGAFDKRETMTMISEFDGMQDVIIKSFPIENYFLLHFENRNYLHVTPRKVFFVPPDKPKFEMHDLKSKEIKEYSTLDLWNSPTPSETELYNRLSDVNPHKLFESVSDRVQSEYSINVRIDGLDENHFAITYRPGLINNGLFYENRMSIWEFNSDSVWFEKNFLISTPFESYIDDKGDQYFGFPDFMVGSFIYQDKKRYQIAIEPHADWTDRNAENVKKQQNESLLLNNFELCIYIGEMDF